LQDYAMKYRFQLENAGLVKYLSGYQ